MSHLSAQRLTALEDDAILRFSPWVMLYGRDVECRLIDGLLDGARQALRALVLPRSACSGNLRPPRRRALGGRARTSFGPLVRRSVATAPAPAGRRRSFKSQHQEGGGAAVPEPAYVASHLRQVFTKLGISSRAEIRDVSLTGLSTAAPPRALTGSSCRSASVRLRFFQRQCSVTSINTFPTAPS